MLRRKKMKGSKRAILIIIIILLLAVISYLVYANFFTGNKKILTTKSLKTLSNEIIIMPGLNPKLMDDFLVKSPYIDFKQHGDLPIKIDQMGRTNPFRAIPFFIISDE